MDLLKDLDIFEADDSDAFSARAEIIPLITKEDESFLLNEDSIPDDMPLLPLHGNVLFPGVVLPIGVSRKASLRLLRDAEKNHERIIVVAQRNDNQLPEMDDLYQIGVIARVLRVIELPRDNHLAIIQGTMKCQLLSITAEEPYYRGCAVLIDENNHQPRSRSFHNRVLAIRKEYSDMEQMKNNGVGLNPKDIFNSLGNITSDKILINFIASHLDIPVKPKQEMLDADGYDRRSTNSSRKRMTITACATTSRAKPVRNWTASSASISSTSRCASSRTNWAEPHPTRI